MKDQDLKELFKKFEGVTALIIGDVMIDAYLWGKVERISPEAPVPVVQITQKENRLGGAANVALNVLAMGARPIICAVAGADQKGEELKEILSEKGMTCLGILQSKARPTTVKTRVISNHQHIVRVDEESTAPLNKEDEKAFIEKLIRIISSEKPEVIIFEDYNKGVLTPKVISTIIAVANDAGIETAVDPKKENFFAFKNVGLFKPNLKELVEGIKIDIDKKNLASLETAVVKLESKINNRISLITLSEEGIYVKQGEESRNIPAHLRKISDVSGAGDTVIVVAALCLALGVNHLHIAALANLAGGLVCEKVGVVPIDKSLLLEEARKHLVKP